jgi:hypothetical protein
MKNKSDNANKNWVYVRPMGNPAVKDACLHTPNMFFSYKAGAYILPKNELPAAHPGIKAGFITESYKELLVKDFQGKQIDSTLRSSIGQVFSQEMGEQTYKEFLDRVNNAKNKPVEQKEQATTQNEKDVNEEVKKNHVPLAFIRGTKELNEALHMTPGIRFSMSTKLWYLPLTDLAKAHPMLKQASVYDSLSNVFTKGGTQISAALRETIGTQYDEKLGQEMLTAYKEKKSQQNTNTEKRVYEQKKTQTNTQTQKQEEKQVQTKHYYRKGR